MSAVSWMGLGKLGGPCAWALGTYGGHDVVGYDINPAPDPTFDVKRVLTIEKLVEHTDDVVYVAVQTPHAPEFGGETPMDDEYVPQDFEYGYLINAVRTLANAARELSKNIKIVVVSTVLPGTMDKHIRPLLNVHTTLIYHPFFIAMGTVIDDFTNPEFVLIGVDTPGDERAVLDIYETLHNAPASVISVASAELTKVAYNTFITMKIVFANTMAEMADHTGADVDQVTASLAMGSQRIISPAYMTAGMGDGGACHPRDNIAMSALAAKHDMSVDLMGFLIAARQYQTGWHASIIAKWHDLTGLDITILGKSYKPGVDSTAGSPALLLSALLTRSHIKHLHSDYVVDGTGPSDVSRNFKPRIFFIATRHEGYAMAAYPAGSVVIDPFGFVSAPSGVTLVTPGRK